MGKYFNLDPPNLCLYQLKKISTDIPPHIYSALRYLGVIIDKYIWYSSTKFADADHTGTLDSWYGTQNEEKNTYSDVIDV